MRRFLLLVALCAACEVLPTGASDAFLSARAVRSAGVLRIENIGSQPVTVTALGTNQAAVVDLAPCDTWRSVAAGGSTTFPLPEGETEMTVYSCVFPSPAPARPSTSGSLRVRI